MSLNFRVEATTELEVPSVSWWPFQNGSMSTFLRIFSDQQTINSGVDRHAQTANLRIKIDSGLTPGPIGFGLNAEGFVSADIFSSQDAGNMAHLNSDGTRADEPLWTYLGEYGIRLQSGDAILRYGLQKPSNPFLDSHDNRGLPPTFHGLTLTMPLSIGLRGEAGSISRVVPRGMKTSQSLSTSYGNIPVQRFDFAGFVYDKGNGTNASLYAGNAQDIWTQYFFSAETVFGDSKANHVVGAAAVYLTHDSGQAYEGQINTKAFSLSLSPHWGATSATVGYQQIIGNQFFDYMGETSGMRLSNVYAVDYNAPHERSLLFSLSTNLDVLGKPNIKTTIWHVQGWGADAQNTAQKHSNLSDPLHSLYWKNGEPVQGRHQEVGFLLEHEGKKANKKLILIRHFGSPFYSDDSFSEIRFTLERTF